MRFGDSDVDEHGSIALLRNPIQKIARSLCKRVVLV
jgi:hypothetical protein